MGEAECAPCSLRFCSARPGSVQVLWVDEEKEGEPIEREYARLEESVSPTGTACRRHRRCRRLRRLRWLRVFRRGAASLAKQRPGWLPAWPSLELVC